MWKYLSAEPGDALDFMCILCEINMLVALIAKKVTLSEAERKLAGIPLSATDFGWACPLGFKDPEEMAAIRLQTDHAGFDFIRGGGFLYFEKRQCVQASGVVQAPGLNFSPPGT